MWRHLLGVVESVTIDLLQISGGVYQWKNFENRSIFGEAMDKHFVSFVFLTHGVYTIKVKIKVKTASETVPVAWPCQWIQGWRWSASWVADECSTFTGIPQFWRTWQRKSEHSLQLLVLSLSALLLDFYIDRNSLRTLCNSVVFKMVLLTVPVHELCSVFLLSSRVINNVCICV